MSDSTATSTPANERLSPIVSLQHRDFRLLWLGQVISIAGTQMQTITINWHIYNLTNSAVALGLIGLVRVLPIIVFSLVGGVYADAHDRRRIQMITQTLMMIFAAILGIITWLNWVNAPIIYLLTALTAATSAFDNPARQAMLPNLVPKEHFTNAMSLWNMGLQLSSIAGPALAGFVIGGMGIAVVYIINALSFLAVLIALIIMHPPAQQRMVGARVSTGALTEGIQFVVRNRIIFSTMMLDFFATFFSSASALIPIFARDILRVGPEGLGILYSAESVGALVAGTAVAFFGDIRRKGAVLLASVGLYGLATALYGGSAWFPLSLLFLGCVGAADTVSTILRNTIRQMSTPDEIRGRMTSVNMMFFMGGPQLGNLEAGLLAAAVGAPLSVISGGIATIFFVGLTAYLAPQLRHYRD